MLEATSASRLRGRRRFIDRNASGEDVVIDASILSPGPLTGFDVAFDRPTRCSASDRRKRGITPSGFSIGCARRSTVTDRAVAAAGSGASSWFRYEARCGPRRMPPTTSWRMRCQRGFPRSYRSSHPHLSEASLPHSDCARDTLTARACPEQTAPLTSPFVRERPTLWAQTRRRSGVRSAARSAAAAAPSSRAGREVGHHPELGHEHGLGAGIARRPSTSSLHRR